MKGSRQMQIKLGAQPVSLPTLWPHSTLLLLLAEPFPASGLSQGICPLEGKPVTPSIFPHQRLSSTELGTQKEFVTTVKFNVVE